MPELASRACGTAGFVKKYSTIKGSSFAYEYIGGPSLGESI